MPQIQNTYWIRLAQDLQPRAGTNTWLLYQEISHLKKISLTNSYEIIFCYLFCCQSSYRQFHLLFQGLLKICFWILSDYSRDLQNLLLCYINQLLFCSLNRYCTKLQLVKPEESEETCLSHIISLTDAIENHLVDIFFYYFWYKGNAGRNL